MENKNFNEIKNFVQGRYVAASEAAWRIFKFPIQQHSPIVYRLAIHLNHEHSITYNPDDLNGLISQINEVDDHELIDEIDLLLNRTIQSDLNDSNNILSNEQQKILALLKKNNQTTLMAWFKLNQNDPNAR